MGSDDRTRASNAVVAAVGLFTTLLGEAEREGRGWEQDVQALRRVNEEQGRLLTFEHEVQAKSRVALVEALRAVGVMVPTEMLLPQLVAYAGERLASYAALFMRKRLPLPSGSGAVVEAALVLMKALHDEHERQLHVHWNRFSCAVNALGKPPSADYRKAERAAAEYAIRYFQAAVPDVGRRGVTHGELYDIGEALVEAEAEIKVQYSPNEPMDGAPS